MEEIVFMLIDVTGNLQYVEADERYDLDVCEKSLTWFMKLWRIHMVWFLE